MEFYIGLMGSLVGGLILAVTTISLFMYEKKLALKRSDKYMNEFKEIYKQRLNEDLINMAGNNKSHTNKFN